MPEERQEMLAAAHAGSMCGALHDIAERARMVLKHGGDKDAALSEILATARAELDRLE